MLVGFRSADSLKLEKSNGGTLYANRNLANEDYYIN